MNDKYFDTLIKLEQDSNLRKLREPIPDSMVNLSSNDYLGLGDDRSIRAEFQETVSIEKLSFSAVSSRLLTGNSMEYSKLENVIAQAYNREACLVYNSGYHLNIGVLPAIAGKHDLILADKMVHASIIDGMRLSHADVIRFNHLNYNQLEKLLSNKSTKYEHVFIVTESIFSMDGDISDLQILVELKKRFKAYLYLDEAHAVGVKGNYGYGLAEENGLISEVDFIVGTFGKALASVGAFLVCDSVFKKYLVNRSRSLIFTTALPPINLAWTKFIFDKLPSFTQQREQLHELSSHCADALKISAQSHIIPFILGSNKKAVIFAEHLRDKGFFILPIRHPTVPKGTARIRLSLKANLKIEQLMPMLQFLTHHEENIFY